MSKKITVTNKPITLEDLRSFISQNPKIELSTEVKKTIQSSRKFLEKKIAVPGARYYGINTGFGALYDVEIPKDQLEQLQKNLVMSHACGMGDEVKPEVVRLMMLLKIKGLSLGYSGVTLETLQHLVEFVQQ